MATEVDIANLALARLGDRANIASFTEGSPQSDHCARFYPIARNSLLEMHPWGFATYRETLALMSSNVTEWAYMYAQPELLVNVLGIYAADAVDDYSTPVVTSSSEYSQLTSSGYALYTGGLGGQGIYTQQPYACETDYVTGMPVIYTNQDGAVCRHTKLITDASKFSPLFTDTLAWMLAANVAGPLIKGSESMSVSEKCMGMVKARLADAVESDANQQRNQVRQNTTWISGR